MCEDYNKTWDSFWKDIVTKEDGTIDLEQIKRELADFYYVMNEVPKVYMEITGGELSKIMYTAETVIGLYNQQVEKLIEEALEEARLHPQE